MAAQDIHLLRELIVRHAFGHGTSKLYGENVAAYETLRAGAASLTLMRNVSEFVRDECAAASGLRVKAAVTKQDLAAEREGLRVEQAGRTISASIIAQPELWYRGGDCDRRQWGGGAVLDIRLVDGFSVGEGL